MKTPPSRLKAVLIALAVTTIWATSWIFIKIGLEDIPGLTFAGLRYSLATLFLLPFLLRKPIRAGNEDVIQKFLDKTDCSGCCSLCFGAGRTIPWIILSSVSYGWSGTQSVFTFCCFDRICRYKGKTFLVTMVGRVIEPWQASFSIFPLLTDLREISSGGYLQY